MEITENIRTVVFPNSIFEQIFPYLTKGIRKLRKLHFISLFFQNTVYWAENTISLFTMKLFRKIVVYFSRYGSNVVVTDFRPFVVGQEVSWTKVYFELGK